MRTFSINQLSDWQPFLGSLPLVDGINLGLIGPLGAGKTTLVQHLAHQLGFASVTSPTYTLNQRHSNAVATLSHWDLYRLGTAASSDVILEDLKADLADPNILTVVEWAELAPELHRHFNHVITITPISETGRQVKVSP